tara:strand:+ start:191 stop:1237 length:1047 start_codon:yes stop_codon:yes gene_type:complete
MKLTVSKLKQLIQETLTESWMDEVGPPPDTSTPSGQADYEDWERRARGHAAFVAMGEDDDEMDLELNYEEFDLATAALLYADSLANEKKLHDPPWAKAVYTVLDSQYGEDPGYVDTGNHIVEISKPSLRTLNWALNIRELPAWLEDNKYIDDESIAELPALKERVQALLAVEEKQPEPLKAEPKPEQEPEVPEDERIDPRFAHLEFDESLKRNRTGNTMKITTQDLKQLIYEVLEDNDRSRKSFDWARAVAFPIVREIGDLIRSTFGDERVGQIRTAERTRSTPVHWEIIVPIESEAGGLPILVHIKVLEQYAQVKVGDSEFATIEYPQVEAEGGLANKIVAHLSTLI